MCVIELLTIPHCLLYYCKHKKQFAILRVARVVTLRHARKQTNKSEVKYEQEIQPSLGRTRR